MDGILLVNKPKGYTSHDIVNIVRKTLHTKKVGHCGTLDPDASGVLVVCVNKATKAIQFLTADNKEYIATLSLGVSTDTYDASGKVIEQKEVKDIQEDNILAVFKHFLGTQEQMPPIYSAIKVKGKKLYEYAREGQDVEIQPRTIHIEDMQLMKIEGQDITFKVKCSKGTYIRSLCVDIAKQLGYPGHMKDLVRTCSGKFSIESCDSIEEIKNGNFHLISIDEGLKDYPKIIVDNENIVFHGQQIKSHLQGWVAVCNKQGHILAIYEPAQNGYLKNVRGLW